MLEAVFAVPGRLDQPTGGYAYARRLLALLPGAGVRANHLALPGSFPHPNDADLAESARRLSAAPPGAVLLVDGLAYGALPAGLIEGIGRPIVALVHHPLAFEAGLDAARRRALLSGEREALARARRVVASSAFTARLLAAEFGVPPHKIDVAEPGAESAPRATGTGAPVRLLAVGAVSPRKGFDILVEALAGLEDLDWRLAIAGSLDRTPEAAAALQGAIETARLTERVALVGAVDDDALAALYAAADLYVSPSLFEGYGMALAEALARGLPLVASTGGAAGETVPDGAGLKVPPGDVPVLREALRRMIAEPDLRRACAERSWAAGQLLPRWADTAAIVAGALKAAAR